MYAKLSRGNVSGVAPPISFYIPWQVIRYMACLCSSYGADIKQVRPNSKRKVGKTVIWLETPSTAEKILNPSRFDGTNVLKKRKHRKQKVAGSKKSELKYDGMAKIVVTKYTPIRLDYSHNNCLKIWTTNTTKNHNTADCF